MILLDTHVVIWLAHEHHRLSPKAHAAIQEARKKAPGSQVTDEFI